ncbi:hypothetical protein BCR35DRAFT_301865 [Leucosporidium creatinivorum]|uniref:Subtelomeric hrmA-associated cluster protein AFUB-079030/YDR124W-like helical bundle domain-containing protein n=1 Tax=Leucosporidium creatinivorum TaxID=106004 RepID=A0A1Y2FYQ6_9BASI|nr:hypothetical protein BCR35DRAFT_301865 [Leucosporidium creatinivorum]
MKVNRQRALPFSSPRRAAAHHRRQRADILRQLGLASYINGSQFAILWVEPTGETETYASEALQPLLAAYFDEDKLQRSRDASSRLKQRKALDKHAEEATRMGSDVFGPTGEAVSLESQDAFDPDDDEDSEEEQLAREQGLPYLKTTETKRQPVLSRPTSAAGDSARPPSRQQPAPVQQLPTPSRPHPYSTTPAATPNSPPLVPTRVTRSLSLANAEPPHLSPSLISAIPSTAPIYVPYTFNPSTLAEWYTEKFSTLPQKVSKTVCKIWVKVVEPDKQANFPYIAGDSHAPQWWPKDVRHKEPDHLIKPERITLLATLLRATSLPVSDFERATAKASALIPAKQAPTLDEIYKVAREERRALQASGGNPFEFLTVLLPAATASTRGEEEDSPRASTFNAEDRPTRHRSRRSITSMPSLPPSLDTTPRSRQGAQPYPLSRSHSVSEVHTLSPATSRPLARSHSLTSHMSSAAGKERSAVSKSKTSRRGRASLGGVIEGDDFGAFDDGTALAMAEFGLQPAISLQHHLEPRPSSSNDTRRHSYHEGHSYQLHDGPSPSSSRLQVSPSGSSLRRSPSSASNEPSFASPAMIKSRSRLSQQPLGSIAEAGASSQTGGAGEFGQRSTSGGSSSSTSGRARPSALLQVHASHDLDPQGAYSNDYPTPTYPPSNPLYHAQQPPHHHHSPAPRPSQPPSHSQQHPHRHHAPPLPPPPMVPHQPSPVLFQTSTFGAFPDDSPQPSPYYDHRPLHEHTHDPYTPSYVHQAIPSHQQQQHQASPYYYSPAALDVGVTGDAPGMTYMHPPLQEYDYTLQHPQPHAVYGMSPDLGGGAFAAGSLGGGEMDMYEEERRREEARRRYQEHAYGVQG